jgi:hypothetical protein
MSSDSPCKLLNGLGIQSAHQLILGFNEEMRLKTSNYVNKIGDIYKERYDEVRKLHDEIVKSTLAWQKLFMGESSIIEYSPSFF